MIFLPISTLTFTYNHIRIICKTTQLILQYFVVLIFELIIIDANLNYEKVYLTNISNGRYEKL